MNAFRTISGAKGIPQNKFGFTMQAIDLPLCASVNLDGTMIDSKYGFVCTEYDIKVLDAWYNWKDNEPMPEILKDRISK